MTRHGYSEDYDGDAQWAYIRWQGALKSAIRGRRGQAFLRELVAALDALPEKRLVAEALEAEGSHCALGAVGRARGIDMSRLDPENWGKVATAFGIPETLAREIMYENDDGFSGGDDEDVRRFEWMRRWALRNLSATTLIGEPEETNDD